MRIIGIDPGYAIVGYGVIDYIGNRFTSIHDDIKTIIERTTPELLAIEELFFNSNQKTAINVAQARGVLLLSALNHGISVHEYTPLQVKQAVVGYGRAEKKQVQLLVKSILGLEKVPKPDDTADALAIAVCHAHSYNPRVQNILNQS